MPRPPFGERLDTMEQTFRDLEQIVRPEKVNQYKQNLTQVTKDAIDLMNATKQEFTGIVAKAAEKEEKVDKFCKIARGFEKVMEEFRKHVDSELRAANDRIKDAHDIANNIETMIRDVQGKVQKLEENKENIVNNAHENAAHIIGTELVDYDDREKLQCWDVSPKLVYSFAGMHHASDEAAKVDAMNWAIKNLFSHARGCRLATVDANRASACAKIAEQGFASYDDTNKRWTLTALGRQSVQILLRLTSPRSAFEPRFGIPLEDMSVVELHELLNRAGFTFRIPESGQSIPAYEHGKSDRVWYMKPRGSSFNKFYFVALLKAHELRVPVKHLQSQAYYVAILAGKEPHASDGLSFRRIGGGRKRKAICSSNASRRQPRSEHLAICDDVDPTDDLECSTFKRDVIDDATLSESSSSAPDENRMDDCDPNAIRERLFDELSSGNEQPVVDIDQGSAPASSSSAALKFSPDAIVAPVRVQRIGRGTDYWRGFKFTEIHNEQYSRVAIRGRAFSLRVPL